jgi:hypothetical protein
MRAATLTLGLAALAAGTLLAQQPAQGAGSQSVTLTFARFFDVACNCYKARLAGRTRAAARARRSS